MNFSYTTFDNNSPTDEEMLDTDGAVSPANYTEGKGPDSRAQGTAGSAENRCLMVFLSITRARRTYRRVRCQLPIHLRRHFGAEIGPI